MQDNSRSIAETVRGLKRKGTPLVLIRTWDQWQTVAVVEGALNGAPKLSWDAARGLRPLNDEAKTWLARLGDQVVSKSTNPRTMLELALTLPDKATLFAVNFHRFIDDAIIATWLGVIREQFKRNNRTLVLLAPQLQLPSELTQDVVQLDEPLPDDAQLAAILANVYKGTQDAPALTDEVTRGAVRATRGLSAFMAEQTFSNSMLVRGAHLDVREALRQKKLQINNTPGLTWEEPTYTFADVRGLDAIQQFLERRFSGRNVPEAILRIDELDKHLGNVEGDLSGTQRKALGTTCRWMEDYRAEGLVAMGIGGTGKSLISKVLGASYNLPTVELNYGKAEGQGLVGQASREIEQAIATIQALAGKGRVFVIGTCNRDIALPPELRRRFTRGIWYFEPPSAQGRADIWKLYLSKFPEVMPDIPNDEGWTGAEIRNCVELAYDLAITPREAAQYILPVAVSAPDVLRDLRSQANGRWFDAARGGLFNRDRADAESGRKVEF